MHRLAAVLPLVILLASPAAARAEGELYTLAGDASDSLIVDGRPAARIELFTAPAIAPLPGGGFVFESGTRVWRVDRQGLVHLVAGTGDFETSGDGGPAVKAGVDPEELAVLPDGRILIGDTSNDRVRMVDARGIITTVAGGGGRRGDGVPASRARIEDLTALAAAPDGGFVIVDHYYGLIRRVGPDGRIRTIAGDGQIPNFPPPAQGEPARTASISVADVAVAGDGSVLLIDGDDPRVLRVGTDGALRVAAQIPDGADDASSVAAEPFGGILLLTSEPRPTVWRFAPDGSVHAIAGSGPVTLSAPPDLLQHLVGESALRAPLVDTGSVEAMPDGGVLLGGADSGIEDLAGVVDYIAPAAPQVLAAGLLRTRDRVIAPQTFASVALTRPATVKLSVAGHSTTAQLPAGVSRVGLPSVPADRPHRVWLRADGADDQRAHDAARVFPPGWLPRETAQAVARFVAPRILREVGYDGPTSICHRRAAAHIDCRLLGGHKGDCGVAAITFTDHHLRWSAYACGRRKPQLRRARALSRRLAHCEPGEPGCLAGRVEEAALVPAR